MKRYNQLSLEKKKTAQVKALNTILKDIGEGVLVFGAEVQEHVDKAIDEMERMQTPWFLAERLMEDEFLAKKFKKWAFRLAQEAFYPKLKESVLRI